MQADLGLHCLLTESKDTVVDSMETVVYVHEHRMLRLDCTDAHADLDITLPANCIRAIFVL